MHNSHVNSNVAGFNTTRRGIKFLAAFLLPALCLSLPARAGLFSDDEARKAIADLRTELRAEMLQLRSSEDTRFIRMESLIDGLQKSLDASQKSVDAYQKSIDALQKSLETLQKSSDAQVKSVADSLQKSIDRVDQSGKAGLVTFQGRLDNLSAEIAKVHGEIEVQDNSIVQADKRNKALYLDLDNRLKAIEQLSADLNAKIVKVTETLADFQAEMKSQEAKSQDVKPEPEKTAEESKAPEPKASESKAAAAPTPAEQKAYDQAVALFKAANYVGSVKAFQGFLKSFANGPLEAQAQFWLGVSHYRLKAYTAAENEFKGLIKKHPESPKAPDAYFNLASAQLDEGNAQAAHDTLDELINRYPTSDAAGKAKARLGRK